MSVPLVARAAETSQPIHDLLSQRWSPRAFDAAVEVPDVALTAMLEAARWAPSANNTQPWKFIVARKGTPEHDTVVTNLLGFNQTWANQAPVLIVNCAAVDGSDGAPNRFASYDLGQSVAYLCAQAHHDGFYAHQMGGFRQAELAEAFAIPAPFVPLTVTAIGALGGPEMLSSDELREREMQPRTRKPLDEMVFTPGR